MYVTSEEYLNEQKQALREKSYVFIYMGLINLVAKNAAQVTSGLAPYSNVDSAFRTNKHEEVAEYATLEQNFSKVNGSNAFLPRSATFYNNKQGLVALNVNTKIRITFKNTVNINIKGFTIDFGEHYPTQFTITNGDVSYTYDKEDDSLFSCEDIFDSSPYIDIIPISMVGGDQRLRIRSLEFGVGLSFNNEQIISSQRRNSVSHISDTLPLKAFDFTISNLSRKFSQDNPRSFSNYIQQGQMVEFQYGRDIVYGEDDTEIYMIPGGKTYIKTWSSNDMEVKFSTVGKLDMMDTEFYKGQIYFSAYKTLYDIARDVLEDAGFTRDEYFISDYLDKIYVFNPLPITTHKACLQMIASASESVLYEDREGRICLKSSFLPDNSNVSITSSKMVMANEKMVDGQYELYMYASLENGYTRVDNKMHFRPRNSSAERSGYVSTINEDYYMGDFTLRYNVKWTCYGITIELSEILPREIRVIFYDNNTSLDGQLAFYWNDDGYYNVTVKFESYELIPEYNGLYYILKLRFPAVENFNRVRIQCEIWNSDTGYIINEYDDYIATENNDRLYFDTLYTQRVHIGHILLENKSGYTITNMDLKEKPVATSLDLVKQINVKSYQFNIPNEIKQLANPVVTLTTATNKNIVKLSNAAYSYSVLWDDGTEEWSDSKTYSINDIVRYQGLKHKSLVNNNIGVKPYASSTYYWETITESGISIAESGAYYLELTVTSIPSGVSKALIFGKQFEVVVTDNIQALNDLGSNITLSNQLISPHERNEEFFGKTWANEISDYIIGDNQSTTEYTIAYRGEPALDCDDLVYLENQFVNNNLCRIEEEEISTATGMSLSNSMKLRRISYDLD